MSPFAGAGAITRLILRRDRIRLPVWVLAILLTLVSSADAVQGVYGTQRDLDIYAETIGSSPASVIMSGPPTALHTLGGVTVFELNTTALVATCLMAIFLAIRHTRAEEESGRSELLRSTRLGRHAALLAAVAVVGAACVLVGLGTAVAMIGLGLPAGGSWLYGASVAMAGVVFTAVGVLAAQVTAHARGALGISGAVLAVSFVVRGIGDVADNALSWLSPLGWSQAVHAFGDDRWWPLTLSAVVAAALFAVAVALGERRDVGAGLVAPRPGPAHASPRLAGVFGLSARLQRTSVIAWSVGMFLGGVAYGSVSREVESLLDDRPDLRDLFAAQGGNVVDAFFAIAVLVLALIGSGFTIGSALRLRSEESSGRVEAVLATPISRWRWGISGLAVTTAGTVVVMCAAGVGLGLAFAISSGDAAALPRLLGATLAYLPAMLVLAGLAILLLGWQPRAASVAWAALAVCFVIGYLGALLNFPDWLTRLSPYDHTPQLPAATMNWPPLVVMVVLACGLAAAGLAGLRRRDLG